MNGTGIRRSDDLEAWLEYRRRHLTSTDVPAILGLSPYSTPLGVWLEKTGNRQSVEQSNKDVLEWGSRMEPMALDWLSDETGVRFTGTDEIIQHPVHEWLCCTPDGFGNDAKGELVGAEVKAPGPYMRDEWANAVPEHAQIQAQVAAYCSGVKRTAICGVIHPRLLWRWVDLDEARMAEIVAECERFWVEHVLADEPPDPIENARDDGFVRELHPEDSGEIKPLSPLAIDASYRLALVEEQVKPLEAEVKLLKNQIKMDMGAASFGTLPGEEWAWSWCRRGDGSRVFRKVSRVPNVKENLDARDPETE